MKNKVLITGASGTLGPRVVQAFSSNGVAVRTFSLDSFTDNAFPSEVETVIGDITDSNAVNEAMVGIDNVVHMAALLHIENPSLHLWNKYQRINVDGTELIVRAAIKNSVRRIVYFSTICVYGATGGKIVSENTQPNPDTVYARTKLDAEKIVLEARATSGELIGTVLRLAAVYGGRVKGNYQRLVTSLGKGRFVPIGDCTNRRTLIYDKDVANAALIAATHEDAGGKIFNVTDGGFHTMAEILGVVCDALGRKPPSFSLPVSPIRRLAGLMEDGARFVRRRSPVNRATIDKFTEDIAVDGCLIRDELGFLPKYDLKTGWKETIEDLRRTGAI